MKNLVLALFATIVLSAAQAQTTDGRYNRYSERPVLLHVLNKAEFDDLQLSIKKTPFADDKKMAFRSLMKGNFITTDQLQLLLKQFTFDDDKLDWTMMAYAYVIDPNKLYTLRKDFAFISTQEKFDEFVQNMANAPRTRVRNRQLMGRDEFATLQAMMSKEMFTDAKKNVFKVALNNRFITVAQVVEIIRQQTFDDDKLAWAILAYNYTADTDHYYQLRRLFTFDSSKEKLDKFLLQVAE